MRAAYIEQTGPPEVIRTGDLPRKAVGTAPLTPFVHEPGAPPRQAISGRLGKSVMSQVWPRKAGADGDLHRNRQPQPS